MVSGDVQFMRKVLRPDHFLYAHLLGTTSRWCAAGQRALDVGCGVGPISLFLASRGCTVVGVDIEERSVTACRLAANHLDLASRAEFVAADFLEAPITGAFDLITCFEVLEHIPDDRSALARIRRLIAPEGVLLISTPSPHESVHRYRMWRHGRDCFDEQAGHLRRYTPSRLCDRLGEAGFRPIEVQRTESIARNILPLTAPGRLVLRAVRSWFTPPYLAVDCALARIFGEGQVIVTARPV